MRTPLILALLVLAAPGLQAGYPTLDMRQVLPKLVQPTSDIRNGNGLIKAYYTTTAYPVGSTYSYRIQLTFVFDDEDAPGVDALYDQQRIKDYGSVRDIETIYLWTDWKGVVRRAQFPTIYCSKAIWSLPQHDDHVVTWGTTGQRTLWVETWNHAMRETNFPGGDGDTTFSPGSGNYGLVKGSRCDAERAYRRAGNACDIQPDL